MEQVKHKNIYIHINKENATQPYYDKAKFNKFISSIKREIEKESKNVKQ